MKQITTYKCESFTRAQDNANLYYISSPAARKINHIARSHFEILNKAGKVIAVFKY